MDRILRDSCEKVDQFHFMSRIDPKLLNGISRPPEVARRRFKSLTSSKFDGDSEFCLGRRRAKREEGEQSTFVSESTAVGKQGGADVERWLPGLRLSRFLNL